MLEVYELITTQLTTLDIPVYADLYPKDKIIEDEGKVYPHIIFNFPNTLNINYSDLNLMEIDIFDNKITMGIIETLAEQVDSIFKSLMINDGNMFVKTYRNNPYRLKLDEETDGIQRRQMRYVVKSMSETI